MNVQFNITPFQKTEYFQHYRTPYAGRKVAAKQQAVVQETKKNQVRTFTHFN